MAVRRILACLLAITLQPAQANLKACVADTAQPPFSFQPSLADPSQHQGLGVDVLQAALAKSGQLPASIETLPFKRCLEMVRAGKIDLIINIATAQIPPDDFAVSEPYYTLHSVYFYRRQSHPTGLAINNLAALSRYQVCALNGYRFDDYGIPPQHLDTGARDYRALLRKLDAGRCDLFIENREIVAGLYSVDAALASQLFSGKFGMAPVPNEPLAQLHFAFYSGITDNGAQLKLLNESIRSLRASGEIDRLLHQYLPN